MLILCLSAAGGADFVTRNSMTFQMGFDNFLKAIPTDKQMAEIVSAVDDEFDLVMLQEYLPQSLILLRFLSHFSLVRVQDPCRFLSCCFIGTKLTESVGISFV